MKYVSAKLPGEGAKWKERKRPNFMVIFSIVFLTYWFIRMFALELSICFLAVTNEAALIINTNK